MDTKTFFENFETIANAPGGIARLRELVLDLAVRGKLVPQNAAEGDTSSLLTQCAESEAMLVKDGLINQPRFQRGQAVVEIPYPIPSSWSWVKLGDISAVVGGGTPSTTNATFWATKEEVPWITPADMRSQVNRYVSRGSRDITKLGLETSSAQLLPTGSVLFSSRAPIGHVGIAANPLATNQGFKSCVPYLAEMSEFIYLFLRKAGKEIDAMATGTTFREVSGKQVAQVLIPVPPIAEQKRIVAKVDELMALCDQLEAAQQQRDSLRSAARNSAIDSISMASNTEELGVAWKRINQNWIMFADTPESISSLRSLILDLAVRGRLLPKATNWKTCKLGEITKIRTGKLDANASSPDGEFPFFTCAKDPLKISTYSYDTECVLLAGNGNFDVNYYSGKFDAYQRTYIIEARNPDELFVPFLYRFMQGHSRKLLEQSIGGVIKYIKIGFLTHAYFELPSLSEQKKIVAKVDDLMRFCDELENHLRIRNESQLRLCRAVTSSAAA